MVHLKTYIITRWVEKLKKDKILAIICGFDPDDVPGVSIFYDFLNRFWLSNNEPGKIMLPHKKPKKPSNQTEKLSPKHPNVVKNKPSLTLQLDEVGIVKGSERWKSIYSKNRFSVEKYMKRILDRL